MTGSPLALRLWHVGLVLTAIVVWATWPFAASLGSGVTDLGDPLLNAWALAWNAHAMVTNPAGIFDANIFHPERATLAYSELLLLPSLAVAPLLWLGVDPIFAHNLLVLTGYVLSGLGTFVLVRRLTGHDGAALVSACAFALYPYRIEAFPKVQLALTVWWPVALLAVHRIAATTGWRPVLAASLALAAECYTCLYYGVFGGLVIAGVATVLLVMARSGRDRLARRFLLAGIGAAIFVAPLAVPYGAASVVVGERSIGEVRSWSATIGDYGRAHPENWLYGDEHRSGHAERRLFPGFTTPLLALAALVPPVAPPTLAYVAAGAVGVNLSLGTNVPGYAWLFEHVAPLRALRVPARFGMAVGLVLAVLAGLGVARLIGGRSRGVQLALVSAAVVLVSAEGAMRTQTLSFLPEPAPAVYEWLADQPEGVVCEYPVGRLEGRVGPQDPTYMYYSTRHWKPLVNGYSGFAPVSYLDLLGALADFPDDRSVAYLRSRGVTYLLVHEPFYITGNYAADVAALRARADLRWTGRFRWKGGGSSDVFVVLR